jgi:hypothetical protein
MGWTGTEIKAFVTAVAGKMEPMAVAAQVFANVNLGDYPRSTVGGNPTAGTWEAGSLVIGYDEVMWLCITAGTPGVWYSSDGSVYPTTTYQGKPGGAVADVNALKAVAVADREDKQVRLVESLGEQFRFDSASALAGDDIKVIAPTAGTGRWLIVEEAVLFTSVTVVAKNGKTAAQGATGSFEKPYSTVAAGVAAGGLVLVAPGTYTETAPLTAMVTGTVLSSMGGPVVITAAAGKIGVIAASRVVAIDGDITVQGIADSNTIELADGGGGAATTLTLTNHAVINSTGTGHAVAVLGKGQLNVDGGTAYAAGTGNGINLAGATSNLVYNSATSSIGGALAVNQAGASTCVFYNGVPTNCSFAGTVTVLPVTGFTSVKYVAKSGRTVAEGADGSPERPYSTVAAGLAALTSGGLLYVAPGTYTEVAPLSSFVDNTVLSAMGGSVVITVAAGKVGVIGASRNVAIDGPVTVAGVADSNTIELADGGIGAATVLNIKNGATVTSLGTGHAISVLGKGQLNVNDEKCVVSAGGTGNGINLVGATSHLTCKSPLISGTAAINQAAASNVAIYGAMPTGCTFSTPANVSHVPASGYTSVKHVAKNGTTAAAGANGSPELPYSTIAEGLSALTSGGVLLVAPGIYTEVAPLSAFVNNTVLKAMGGTVVITAAAGVIGVIAASRSVALDGLVTVTGFADVNAIELADGGGGAATALALFNGATVTSAGTGHAVAVLGKGTCSNITGVLNALGTGNGCDLANNVAATYAQGVAATCGSVGGVPVNKPANAIATFSGSVPIGCTLTAGAGAATMSGASGVPSYAYASLPLATGVPAGTTVRCSDRPVARYGKAVGAMVVSDGAVWRYVSDGSLVAANLRKTFLEDDYNTVVPIALYTDAEVVATGTAALQVGATGGGNVLLNIPAALDAVTHYFTQISTSPARNPEVENRDVTLSRITDIIAEVGLRTAAGTDIVRFIFNSGVDGFWHYESTAVAGGTTNAATAVAPVGGAGQNLRFVLTSATSVAFYINDVLVGTAAVAANIPAVLMTPYSRAIGLNAAINGTVTVGYTRIDVDA